MCLDSVRSKFIPVMFTFVFTFADCAYAKYLVIIVTMCHYVRLML